MENNEIVKLESVRNMVHSDDFDDHHVDENNSDSISIPFNEDIDEDVLNDIVTHEVVSELCEGVFPMIHSSENVSVNSSQDLTTDVKKLSNLPNEVTNSVISANSDASFSSSTLVNQQTENDVKVDIPTLDQKIVKSFGPAMDRQQNYNRTQMHSRIRRVPSTANPKYKVPPLPRNQRSKSQPVIQSNHLLYPRRNSSPSSLISSNLPNVHSMQFKHGSSVPNMLPNAQSQNQPTSNQQYQQVSNPSEHPQQQIIYLQIPQPSPVQLCDPQGLQQQISSQLQLLVPQIYNQLLNQINANSANLNTVKVSLNQNEANKPSPEDNSSKDSNTDLENYLISSFTMDGNPSQRVKNQLLQQNSLSISALQKTSQAKKQKFSHTQGIQIAGSDEKGNSNNHYLPVNELCQILKQIPPHVLQQSQMNSEVSYIEIQQVPGYPNLKIPLTPELVYYCQQMQQSRDSNVSSFQPRLETILEESLSVKHLKISRFPKTKIIACILTVLCVIVVILLAGDKTVAVAVIAAIFILFLLGSTFYLYTNSAKSDISDHLTRANSHLQVSSIGTMNKPSMV